MADNYLEKKFEEYKAKQSSPRQRVLRTPSGAKPGTLSIKFPCRRIFVTGGAAGIGKAIVEAFRNTGCKVAFCDCDTKTGQATAEATGARFYPADVRDSDALERCLQRVADDWGDIDVLVNNAGISEFKALTDTTIEEFDRIIATNLRPAFVAARWMAHFRQSQTEKNPYGRIINICSTRHLMSEPGSEGYAASKGGMRALTHALAMSLSDFRITVNSISPGWIQTTGYERLKPSDHLQHPSKRMGLPEDIARICLFLSLSENDFINGEDIVADGGMARKMIYEE